MWATATNFKHPDQLMNRAEKYRIFYWPYLIILAGTLLGYSFVHWLLVLRLHWWNPSVTVSHWVLPILLICSFMIAYYHKRIRLLPGKKKDPKDKTEYYLIICALAAGPLVAGQYLLVDLLGELRSLNKPNDILSHPKAMYYNLTDFKTDRYNGYRREIIEHNGNSRRGSDYTLIIALPLYASKDVPGVEKSPLLPDTTIREFKAGRLYGRDIGDTATGPASRPNKTPVWVCWWFHTKISNKLSEEGKREERARFAYRSIFHFETSNPDSFTYLRRPANNDDKFAMERTVQEALNDYEHIPLVVTPVYKSFDDRYSFSLWMFTGLFVGACVLWLVQLATIGFDKREWQRYIAKRRRKQWPGSVTYD